MRSIIKILYKYKTIVLSLAVLAGAVALYGYSAGIPLPAWPISYAMLGRGFLRWHTYLNIPPALKLLALPNPYNPALHVRVPYLLDASLYRRHYYLYFGPVPALLPWLPVKWLTGISLSDRQLALFSSLIGTGCLTWLFASVARRQPALPQWSLWFSTAALCFGTWIPQMLHQPGIYPVPIAGAYCFTAIGLLLLWQETRSSPTACSDTRKLAASLCLGLAVGCRAFCIFNGILLFAAWIGMLQCRKYGRRETIRAAFYLSAPGFYASTCWPSIIMRVSAPSLKRACVNRSATMIYTMEFFIVIGNSPTSGPIFMDISSGRLIIGSRARTGTTPTGYGSTTPFPYGAYGFYSISGDASHGLATPIA